MNSQSSEPKTFSKSKYKSKPDICPLFTWPMRSYIKWILSQIASINHETCLIFIKQRRITLYSIRLATHWSCFIHNIKKRNWSPVLLLLYRKGKLKLSKIVQENASFIMIWQVKNVGYWTDGQNTVLSCTITRQMQIHHCWTVPRHTHRGQPPHPSQRSGGCSTFIEEMEVSWSWQHPSRTGPSRWRGCNHCSHDNLR